MNKEDIKNLLNQKEKEYLSELVIMLLYKMDDEKRQDFTAKYINAKVVLAELNELENSDFLTEVQDFCEACLDGQYYEEAEYDDYYDSYNEDAYKNSEWAKGFAKYFRLTAVRARNGETDTAHKAFVLLFDCISQADYEDEAFGTADALDYVDIDMSDILEAFFEVILKHEKTLISAYSQIFDLFLIYEKYCKMPMPSYLTDLSAATDALKEKVKSGLDFPESEKLFLLIKSLLFRQYKGANKLTKI